MVSNWPKVVVDFEAFLEKVGLWCLRRETSEMFGNKILQYQNDRIGVRVCSDRGRWVVNLADLATRPGKWYDPALLRDLLLGRGADTLSLSEQIEIVEKNWPAIVACFGPTQREDAHSRLARLAKDRLKRRLPELHSRKGESRHYHS